MDVFSALDGVYDLDAPPGEAEAPERAAQAQQAQQQRYAQRLSETTRLDVASITAVRHFGPSPDVLALLHQECDAERECEARGSMLRFVKVFWKQASERFEKQLKARKAAAKKAAKDAAALEKKGRVEKRDAEKRDAKDRKKGKPLALAPDSTTATEAAKPLTAEDKAKAKTVAAAAEAAKKAAQVWAKAAEAEAKAKEKAAAALRDQATSIIRQNMAVDAQAETRSAHEAAKDALERLGAIREQAGNAIRKHHRRRALEVHPDRGGHREAYNLFIQASTILKADSHRARYLKELSQAMGVMQHNFGVAASQANMHSFHEAWIHNNDNVGLFTDAGEEEKKLLEFARRKQRAEKRAEAFMIKADASLSTPAQVLFFATLSDEKVPSLAAPCHTIPVQLRIAEDSDIIAVEVSCDCVAVARKSAVGDMLKGGAISKSFGRAEMDYDRGCFAVRVAHDGGSASGDAFSEGTWAVKWRVSVAREASQHALWSSWSTPADVQVVDRAVEGRDRLREQLRAECDAGAAALSRVVRAATRLGMRVEKKELMHALQFCRKSAEKLQAHKLDGAAADVAAAAAKAVSTARKAVSSAAPALEALEKRDAAEKSRQQRASFLAVLAHKPEAAPGNSRKDRGGLRGMRRG